MDDKVKFHLQLIQHDYQFKQGKTLGSTLAIGYFRCLIICVNKYFTPIQSAFLGRAHHGVDQVSQLPVGRSCFLNGLSPLYQLISDSIPKTNAPIKTAPRSIPITIYNVDFALSAPCATVLRLVQSQGWLKVLQFCKTCCFTRLSLRSEVKQGSAF
jgi:hypothetical protein